MVDWSYGWVPDGAIELTGEGSASEVVLLERLDWALDRLLQDPKRVVHHLDPRGGMSESQPALEAAG